MVQWGIFTARRKLSVCPETDCISLKSLPWPSILLQLVYLNSSHSNMVLLYLLCGSETREKWSVDWLLFKEQWRMWMWYRYNPVPTRQGVGLRILRRGELPRSGSKWRRSLTQLTEENSSFSPINNVCTCSSIRNMFTYKYFKNSFYYLRLRPIRTSEQRTCYNWVLHWLH